jgi:hypothetical protein
MAEHKKKDAKTATVELMPMLDQATPPPCPAPMPRQTLVFWTPRLMLASTLRAVSELRRPQRAVQPAIVSLPNADAPR